MGKKKLLRLLKLASQPVGEAPGKPKAGGNYSEKQTRSHRTAYTSVK